MASGLQKGSTPGSKFVLRVARADDTAKEAISVMNLTLKTMIHLPILGT